jgi:hypothetical protein
MDGRTPTPRCSSASNVCCVALLFLTSSLARGAFSSARSGSNKGHIKLTRRTRSASVGNGLGSSLRPYLSRARRVTRAATPRARTLLNRIPRSNRHFHRSIPSRPCLSTSADYLFATPIRAAPIARHVGSPSHTTTAHWPPGATLRCDPAPCSAVVMHLVARVLEGCCISGWLARPNAFFISVHGCSNVL